MSKYNELEQEESNIPVVFDTSFSNKSPTKFDDIINDLKYNIEKIINESKEYPIIIKSSHNKETRKYEFKIGDILYKSSLKQLLDIVIDKINKESLNNNKLYYNIVYCDVNGGIHCHIEFTYIKSYNCLNKIFYEYFCCFCYYL
jgi:hypothetical protein